MKQLDKKKPVSGRKNFLFLKKELGHSLALTRRLLRDSSVADDGDELGFSYKELMKSYSNWNDGR